MSDIIHNMMRVKDGDPSKNGIDDRGERQHCGRGCAGGLKDDGGERGIWNVLTAQNTAGVLDTFEVSPSFLRSQLDAVFCDLPPCAVKIGMVGSKPLICTIAERLKFYRAKNIVIDPVMVSSSGVRLLKEDALGALSEELFPPATLITPNLPEAEVLCGQKIQSIEDTERAARELSQKFGCGVLLKGGHRENDANDYLFFRGVGEWLCGERVQGVNVHGTGCTLSSAIASNLAKGYPLTKAVKRAKVYLSLALKEGTLLGKGAGLLDHMFESFGEFRE